MNAYFYVKWQAISFRPRNAVWEPLNQTSENSELSFQLWEDETLRDPESLRDALFFHENSPL